MTGDIHEALNTVLTAIGALMVAGSGSAGIGYALFKAFGERWLGAKFDEQLASYKHEQQKKIEHVKFEISKLMDRTIKLHAKEYDVLPEAWSLLNDAFYAVRSVGLGFARYPDVNRLTDEQIDDLLDRNDFADWQKAELRHVKDKTRYYGNMIEQRTSTTPANRFIYLINTYLPTAFLCRQI